MGAAPSIQMTDARADYARLLLERLVADIRRVERQYPVWDCGLSEMCSLDHIAGFVVATPRPAPPPDPEALQSQLSVLDVTRELGLVPLHEYRRERRDILRRLRMTRLGHAPVLAHVVDLGVTVAEGYEDGVRALAGMTDRVCRWRLGQSS
jgi:hypothetical protein